MNKRIQKIKDQIKEFTYLNADLVIMGNEVGVTFDSFEDKERFKTTDYGEIIGKTFAIADEDGSTIFYSMGIAND